MSIRPGSIVSEGVRLERLLAQGGMGSVWIAEHLRLGVRVAVKFMSPALAKDPAALERFTREARLTSRIRSPHVVQIFDFRVLDDALPYMVMELLEGEDLGTRLERTTPLSLAETAELVAHVAKALGRAHALGIVHRDVKPENIFLMEQDGRFFAKLLDFGIAKEDGGSLEVTAKHATMGTPHFMSPEQMLSSGEVDGRSDLWSLAVVAYAALTKRLPFDGETFAAVCIKIDRGEFTPPSEIVASLPSEIDGWFTRALARDPATRFQTAREMSDALLEAVYGRRAPSLLRVPAPLRASVPPHLNEDTPPPSVRNASSVPPPPMRRSRGVTFALGTAAAALFVGATSMTLAWRDAPADPAAGAAPAQMPSPTPGPVPSPSPSPTPTPPPGFDAAPPVPVPGPIDAGGPPPAPPTIDAGIPGPPVARDF